MTAHNAKYTFVPPNTYITFKVDFGRRSKSFATLVEAQQYLETKEATDLIKQSEGYVLTEISTVVLKRVNL